MVAWQKEIKVNKKQSTTSTATSDFIPKENYLKLTSEMQTHYLLENSV